MSNELGKIQVNIKSLENKQKTTAKHCLYFDSNTHIYIFSIQYKVQN